MRKFVLDLDHVSLIGDCLRFENIRLSSDQMAAFVPDIREDIKVFCNARKEYSRFREIHNQLRRLWKLAAKERPHLEPLQKAIKNLSSGATQYIDRRFPNVMERLSLARPNGIDFKTWAQTPGIELKILANVSRLVAAEGAEIVPGRSRGRGKHSSSQVSPTIMGFTRGGTTDSPRGGRPNNGLMIDLVLRLALSWLSATGQEPKRGRSDKTGFGKLVFLVFEWLSLLDEEGDESGVHALRQYWSMVPIGRVQPEMPPPA